MAGFISYFKLDNWFTTEFTKEEQLFMEKKYSEGSMSNDSLYFGKSSVSYNGTAAMFLSNLLLWYNKKDLYEIALKIAKKAESLFNEKEESAEDKHFYYMNLIKFYYKNREISNNFDTAIFYCEKQISISKDTKKELQNNAMMNMRYLPDHAGYEQLSIIEKKNKNWKRVIELASAAKAEGWGGDWDKRIEEAKGKLHKINTK